MEIFTTKEKEKLSKKIFEISKEIIKEQTREILIKNMTAIKPYLKNQRINWKE